MIKRMRFVYVTIFEYDISDQSENVVCVTTCSCIEKEFKLIFVSRYLRSLFRKYSLVSRFIAMPHYYCPCGSLLKRVSSARSLNSACLRLFISIRCMKVVTRHVTVPSQLKELEMFEKFSFMRTGDVDQLTSSELEMFTSSFHLNWKC